MKTIFDVLDRLEAKTKIQEEKVVPNEVIGIQKDEPISKVALKQLIYNYKCVILCR